MSKQGKKRLGRGLDGLLPAVPAAAKNEPAERGTSTARIEELHPNRDQPRRTFDDEALAELAASIGEHGVLEPILVRKRPKGDGFEIIAGERRWRASQRAGLKEVPIFVRELSDAAAFEAALVENLQREDLNPIETARAFQRLAEEFGHTQEDIAQKVGKDRSTVANSMRLLKLPDDVLDMVEHGSLSEGHGRALLSCESVDSMRKLARAASQKRLSVREVERRARTGGTSKKAAKAREEAQKSANVKDLERRLSEHLGAPVAVEKGKLVVSYADYDVLDEILRRMRFS
ncbi:MAG: chromosome partitioning protein ParB [Rickettsiales bacterium]|nr:chromosome partitioning protein ParB [Rickettsiales bacterium]MAR57305.1 chromosome partitioning protein ParB [Rickettsiales bacterium]